MIHYKVGSNDTAFNVEAYYCSSLEYNGTDSVYYFHSQSKITQQCSQNVIKMIFNPDFGIDAGYPYGDERISNLK
jgi:hypothetical protein